MRQVTVGISISAPREDVYDFVSDLAGRPAYCDHYLHDFRLARVNSVGVGAAARFVVKAAVSREYAELTVREADRPRRIVEELAVGRRGRNRYLAVYDFMQEAGGLTRVELTSWGEPATHIDRLRQLGAARRIRRQTKTALERLRAIFEEHPDEPLRRATIAGYEPAKAPRFGVPVGMDPGRGSH